MKKKLLFTAYSLDVGGIETALINLLKRLDYSKYEVTLILEKKEGLFLNDVPKEVNILEYKISANKIVLFRKIYNRLKLIKWVNKLNKKFDFSCSFATYSIPGAHLALAGSLNNAIWMHGNYYVLYDKDKNKLKEFLDGIFVRKFKRVVFVSNENKKDVCRNYNGISDKACVCNNFINGDDILEKADEVIDYENGKETLFVNVGRHEEHQKRLSRIIEASEELVEQGYKFKVLLIGDGPDHEYYKNMIHEKGLDDVIKMLGKKKNPFPYYKMADAVLLSSEYEGYPVVFLEAQVLNKPIVSTKISDWEELDNQNGLFCECSTNGVFKNMKKFLDKGFKINKKFDYKKYNKDIMDIIEKFINDESK